MSLTAKDVAEIMRLLEESSFDELDLETDGLKLTLRRGSAGVEDARQPAPRRAATPKPAPEPKAAPKPAAKVSAPAADPNLADVPAPLLGVFYRAPKPGEAPFVEVGQTVGPDTVIGIIEVMKLMNSVRAGVAGEVVEILAENGALVEYDETLLRVRKAG